MVVGVLSVQGAVEPHVVKLQTLGVETRHVLQASDLRGLSGLILPGGESTAMIHLLKLNSLWEPLKAFVTSQPAWGICAGAILLAKRVYGPEQISLGAIDVAVQRNAYGRQSQSFISTVEPTQAVAARFSQPIEAVFIRAPKISEVLPSATTLFTYEKEPVVVEQGPCLVSTFHPELTKSTALHEYFLERCRHHGRSFSQMA